MLKCTHVLSRSTTSHLTNPQKRLAKASEQKYGHITKMHLIIFDPGDTSLLLACHLYLRSLDSFTSARLLPLLLLACLYFCSLAAFTSARLLPLLLLACCLYFCSLAAFTFARLLWLIFFLSLVPQVLFFHSASRSELFVARA